MVFTHPQMSSLSVPEVTAPELVGRWARLQPHRAALVWGPTGQVITYGQLWIRSGKVARALQELGVEPGDRVALLAPNCPSYPLAFYGILRAGGAAVPLNPLSKPADVHRCLQETDTQVVLASEDWVARLREGRLASSVRHVLGMDELVEASEPWQEPEPVALDPAHHAACILYSSGTTGLPKGAVLTHRNVVADLLASEAAGLVTKQSRYVHFLPLCHCAGLLTLLNAGLCLGAYQVLLPRFDPGEVLRLVQVHRARELFAVPPALRELVEEARQRGFSYRGLRLVNTAALPLDGDLARRAEAVFGCPITEHIGMTETAGPMNVAVPPQVYKPGSVGPPVPGLEERVVDPDSGRDLGPGAVGELWVRGPMVTVGYWNHPEANAEAFVEGWFRTGDLVRFDTEGHMWWVDRRKEMIKYKGYSIAPAELEEVLRQHPAVQDACVVPRPDPEAGEIPKAFVVRRKEVSAEELLRFAEEHLAPHKRVRAVEFVDELPRSAVGKVLRRVLADRERSGGGG